MPHPLPLYRPLATPDDLAGLESALASGASPGRMRRLLETTVAEIVRRPFGVGVGSPGAAVEVALRALGVGPGDEVIVPALGAVEAADAVVRVHATPVFADVDPRSLGLSAATAEPLVRDRTRAIVAITMLGDAGGLEDLARLCTKHEIPMLEDASDALGGTLGGYPAGRYGRIALVALTDDRVAPASGASVLVTHDDQLAARSRAFRSPHDTADSNEVERVGVDCPLDEYRAAIAVPRLARLEAAHEARRRLADMYLRHLAGQPDLILPSPRGDGGACWPRFCVRLSDRFSRYDRDEILQGLRRHEIHASEGPVAVPNLPRHGPRIGHASGSFPVAERAADRSLCLPFFEGLSEREIDLVCQTLDLMLQRNTFRRD